MKVINVTGEHSIWNIFLIYEFFVWWDKGINRVRFAVCVVCEVPRYPGAGPWVPWPEVMVRVLQLLVLASGVLLLTAAPTPDSDQTTQLDDSSARSERSANLSHITGTARKIRMYIKNRYLQILPDGIVNGTGDDISDYSEFRHNFI